MNIEQAVEQATARAARATFEARDGRETVNLVPANVTKRATKGYHHWRQAMDALQLAVQMDTAELDRL